MLTPRAQFLFVAGLMSAAIASKAQSDEIWVTIDQARALKLERAAGSVIVGNPSIADVTVHDSRTLFVLGKATGLTNLIALDENGEEIANLFVNVSSARNNVVTLNRGGNQYTYNCAHRCERTLMIGDETAAFNNTNEQTVKKIEAGVGSAETARASGS